jgi:hypothetical protein
MNEEKNTKVLTLNNIWSWAPAGLDAKSDRAGWLPAVSYCSALLCLDETERLMQSAVQCSAV